MNQPQFHSEYERQIKAGRMAAGMSFSEKVWALCVRIPRGKVATYGQLARILGTRGARAVGAALRANPYAPQVPCHRVVGRDGALTGYAGGLSKKHQRLKAEKVPWKNGKVDLAACRVNLS